VPEQTRALRRPRARARSRAAVHSPSSHKAVGGISERFYSRTAITGQWACLTTASETLPIKALLIPPRPLLPTTTTRPPSPRPRRRSRAAPLPQVRLRDRSASRPHLLDRRVQHLPRPLFGEVLELLLAHRVLELRPSGVGGFGVERVYGGTLGSGIALPALFGGTGRRRGQILPPSCGRKPVRTTPGVVFRAVVGPDGEVEIAL
jgi:hypothetical protein